MYVLCVRLCSAAILICGLSHALSAQNLDCQTAIVICSDTSFQFLPGAGQFDYNDFSNPNNNASCLIEEESDYGSGWFYFRFQDTMPADSYLEFRLSPLGGYLEDYDFAIYGPNVTCDSLGDPVRCSFARVEFDCDTCYYTGMAEGYFDVSEGAPNEDGFLAPMKVQPGEGYYLIIDHWFDDPSDNDEGFNLDWGGSAAPYLNCGADPACAAFTVSLPDTLQPCASADSLLLGPVAAAGLDLTTAEWTSPSGDLHRLSDPHALYPSVDLSNSAGDTLRYLLRASNGMCEALATCVIVTKLPQAYSLTGGGSICPGDSTVLSVYSHEAAYLWSTGQTKEQITVNTPGTYTVTITYDEGCTSVDSVRVSNHTVTAPQITGRDTFCAGDSTMLNAAGDFAAYAWSNGDTTATALIRQGGQHRLTVTDQNGCRQIAVMPVTELSLPEPALAGASTFCPGDSLVLNPGSGFSSYRWNTGAGSGLLTVHTAGTYAVTVTDEHGCNGSGEWQIDQWAEPDLSIQGPASLCAGDTIMLEVITTASSISWSGGESGAYMPVAGPGDYAVTVTDDNGCSNRASRGIVEYPRPDPGFGTLDTGFCEGSSFLFEAPAGFASYTWSDGPQSPQRTFDGSGSFTLTVTNAEGCSTSAVLNLEAWQRPAPEIAGPAGICTGDTVTLSSVSAFTTYLWSTGEQGNQIRVSQGDDYSLSVTDDRGCEGTVNRTVPVHPVRSPDLPDDLALCPGDSAVLSTAWPYDHFNWNGTDSVSTLLVTAAGAYYLTVTDANGCTYTDSTRVSEYAVQPPQLPAELSLCGGEEADLLAGAGYASYLWSTGEQTEAIQVDSVGTYTVTVVDGNGCRSAASVSVTAREPASLDLPDTAVMCEGATMTLRLPDGFYYPSWSTGENTDSIEVSQPGYYQVRAVDGRGCVSRDTIFIAQFPETPVIIDGPDSFCTGDTVSFTVYPDDLGEYLWSDGTQGPVLQTSQAGTWQVTITGESGCGTDTTIVLQQLPAPVAAITGDTVFCAGSTTTLTAGGSYHRLQWPDGSQADTWSTGEPGTYELLAFSEAGCRTALDFSLSQAGQPVADAGPDRILNCRDSTISLSGSSFPHLSYEWYNEEGELISDQQQMLTNRAGYYYLQTVDTLYSCSSLPDTLLVQDLRFTPQADLLLSNHLDCANPQAELLAETDGAGYELNWTGPGLTPGTININPITIGQAGTYRLEMTDSLTGCSNSIEQFVLIDTLRPEVNLPAPGPLNCEVGSVVLQPSVARAGSTPGFYWYYDGQSEPVDSLPVLETSRAGTYVLQVVNAANGCSATATAVVEDLTAFPQAEAGLLQPLSCTGEAGLIGLLGSSPAAAWHLQWKGTNGQPLGNGPELSVTSAGVYTLSVLDTVSRCRRTFEVVVEDPGDQIRGLDLQLQHPLCAGDDDGFVLVGAIDGGQAPYNVIFNGRYADPYIGDLGPGTYPLAVVDTKGCRLDTTVVIRAGNELSVTVGPDRELLYGSPLQVQSDISSSGQPLADWRWSSNTGEECVSCHGWQIDSLLTDQCLVFTVTDVNGCVASDSLKLTVRKDREIFIPNIFTPNGDGVNDLFEVFAGPNVKAIRYFRLLDRWGNMVWEQTDLAQGRQPGWNGLFRGRPANLGVYVYMLEVEFRDGEVELLSGDVTLAR